MIKIGDRVKQKHTLAQRTGTVVGVWEKDEYLKKENEEILFATKGEIKVRFDDSESVTTYCTFSQTELELI